MDILAVKLGRYNKTSEAKTPMNYILFFNLPNQFKYEIHTISFSFIYSFFK